MLPFQGRSQGRRAVAPTQQIGPPAIEPQLIDACRIRAVTERTRRSPQHGQPVRKAAVEERNEVIVSREPKKRGRSAVSTNCSKQSRMLEKGITKISIIAGTETREPEGIR